MFKPLPLAQQLLNPDLAESLYFARTASGPVMASIR